MDDSSPASNASGHADFLVPAHAMAGFCKDGALTASACAFLEQIYDDISEDERADLATEDMLALAHDFWTWSANRKADAQLVRLRPGMGAGGRRLDRDVLEIAGPDMAFLVTSVMGEIAAAGCTVLALAHPIVPVKRDAAGHRGKGAAVRESLIQVHLAPLVAGADADLLAEIQTTLADVRLAVADHAALRKRMAESADALVVARASAPEDETAEAIAFLRWLNSDNFIFLGARDYQFVRDETGEYAADEPIVLADTGLGLLRDANRFVLRRSDEPSVLTPEIRRFVQEPTPILVSKSSLVSRVHRRVAADYIGVKRYGEDGDVIGETRFVGLFTADAYNAATRDVPLLRRKTARVLAAAGAARGAHDYNVLRNILETYPRDELFQIGELELLQTSLGILHLTDRPRPRLFVRRDRFNRFVSALVYVPKDRFNSGLRARIGEALTAAYGGRLEAFYPLLGEGPLARIHFLIQDIDRARAEPSVEALEADITALSRTWEDRFAAALAQAGADNGERERVIKQFSGAFTAAYRERFPPEAALIDIAELEKTGAQGVRVRAYRLEADAPNHLRCKVYARGHALPLSATMPVLENMGLFVEFETGFLVQPADAAAPYWVHDLSMRTEDGAPLDFQTIEDCFEDAFAAAWTGLAENDGFNRLILKLGIGWRDAALMRALARYRTQTGLDPGQAVQEQALCAHPAITRQILGLFRVRFDTALPEPVKERQAWAAQIEAQIEQGLNAVSSLDEDRVLRRLARLVGAIQRTNFYQPGPDGAPKTHMSFKIASPQLDDLPPPKPYREIWVWSPQVEGVHLRFGPLARGGLRWSDRRDDFRTEVLALAKAQQVKNAIIVPVGAKGGFFPKGRAPGQDVRAHAVDAYKTFLRGLLDITDDIEGGRVVRPGDVVCWDDDDPYLVVAADKGTASFSDIANGVAAEYGFWLGDAFASGGSVGYDHKAMGVTARGAWEAVKRHFREIGTDIQTTAFNVIGVGDMSGDVFGNAMLLSRRIRLIAAFDHRDIFLDPAPADLDAAWRERQRLFDMPGSSWKDYDAAQISQGGGVFSRAAKSIELSAQVRALSGLEKQAVTPSELIAALLASPCDLLWFGGIGTFVKAAGESHADVGDKANDLTRVDAENLRAKVIGEGANLGVTQAGRIAFARAGGRINTDAIDNSAGVDTSDHEVNIKILLAEALRTGALKPEARQPLLAAMREGVAAHVLKHNYEQTLAISLSEAAGGGDRDAQERFVLRLEAQGKLDRAVEGLPSPQAFAALREQGLGLTRPEIAKLIAYAKIDLTGALIASAAPDDPYFDAALRNYFPPQLEKYGDALKGHRLRRELIATILADETINIAGPTFIDRVRESAQTDAGAAVLAFSAARAMFGTDELAARINALDNQAPARAQLLLHADIAVALRRAAIALSRRIASQPGRAIADLVALYRPAIDAQRAAPWPILTEIERANAESVVAAHVAAGAPEAIARQTAALSPLIAALDIADIATAQAWPVQAAARLYRTLGAHFMLDRLRVAAGELTLDQHWERLALRRMLVEINEDQRRLAESVIAASPVAPAADAGPDWAEKAVAAWRAARGALAAPALATIAEMQASGPWSFAKIVLAVAALRSVADRPPSPRGEGR